MYMRIYVCVYVCVCLLLYFNALMVCNQYKGTATTLVPHTVTIKKILLVKFHQHNQQVVTCKPICASALCVREHLFIQIS